jgi:hypothetical protein
MMSLAGAGFLVIGFVMLIKVFRLVPKSIEVLDIVKLALTDLRNADLDDGAKEAAMQGHAKRLMILSSVLLFGGAAALAFPMCLLWVLDWIGLLSFNASMKTAVSWQFLLTSSLVAAAFFGITRKRGGTIFEHRYSFLDRGLHRIAFATLPTQIALAEFENRLFAEQLAQVELEKPLFITALPRAGTTLLLEICAGMKEFASHRYRDMPFVVIPFLWSRF